MKIITKALAAIMLLTMVAFFAGCKPEDEPNNGGDNNGGNGGGGIINHECVDLGLPSGTLWATCNVGATKPEEYGDYFAWGETEPKNIYDWSTYKYSDGVNGNGYDRLSKYNTDSQYGVVDKLIELQTDDDAAVANWGDGWCMPSKAQWEELKNNTSVIWMTQNKVNGWAFKASNGNSLFLPAGGFCYNEILGSVGEAGYYWSSSLYVDYSYWAWGLFFMDNYDDMSYNNIGRCDGRMIRPVRSVE